MGQKKLADMTVGDLLDASKKLATYSMLGNPIRPTEVVILKNTILRTKEAVILNGQVICRPCNHTRDGASYQCNRNNNHRGKHRNGKKEWKK